eukprot:gene12865-biopygen7971
MGETAEDASWTRPFLQILSRGTRPGRVQDASGTRPRPFLPGGPGQKVVACGGLSSISARGYRCSMERCVWPYLPLRCSQAGTDVQCLPLRCDQLCGKFVADATKGMHHTH